MPYRGRYQQGQEVTLGVLCHDNSGTPSVPASCPSMEIWQGTTKITSLLIPVMDRYGQVGLFSYNLFLDGRYGAGLYKAIYHYKVGSYVGIDIDAFEVMAGGSPNGAVVAMNWFVTPQAKFLVYQTTKGRLFNGRNPSF